MKRFFIFWIITSFSTLTYAQSKSVQEYSIRGIVLDEQNKSIPFCNIILYNQVDSTLVSGGISDNNGKFELTAKPGNYYIKISFLSYKPGIIWDIKIINQNNDLGVIFLKGNTATIDEVVVIGEKKQTELHFEKKVYNVGKDISNAGENAAEILTHVPSVSVNTEGDVSLRGSENVSILIDGKPSALIGTKKGIGLRQLQGNLIDKVEVITNPSARYDAAGEVGIINIVLKKNTNKGIHGTFTLNAGHPNNYGGSYSINYRRNNINLFSNYGISYKSLSGSGYSVIKYAGEDTSYFYTENNKQTRNGLSNNFMFGLDYFLNENNVLTGSFVYENVIEKNNYKIEYKDFDIDNEWIQTINRINNETDVEDNIEASVIYKKKFEEKGRELSACFKWLQCTEPEKSIIRQVSTNSQNDILQRTGNTENEYNYLIQADYLQPFNTKGKFEIGLKSNFRIINSNYSFEQQDNETNWFSFPEFNNNFIYNEKIHSVYIMASNEFGKFPIQAGLRGEYSTIGTELLNAENAKEKSYFKLFPSTNLSYKLKQYITLQLSYSYRINRPKFWDLMPFNNFTDTRVLRMGNPNLKPEYIHSFEAGILINPEGITLLSTFYYRNKKGTIFQFETTDTTGVARIFPINLTEQDAFGFETNMSLNLNKWWILNTNFNIYKLITNGTFHGEKLYSSAYTWANRTSSKITFLKKWDFQFALNYHAPYLTPQGKDLSNYYVDLGLSSKLLNGKGSFIISVKDLLNSRKTRSIIDNNGYYSNGSFQWTSRQFMLTFAYRLNGAEKIDVSRVEDDDDD